MKGLGCIVLLLAAFSILSCSKDDSSSDAPKGKLGLITTEDGDQLLLEKITYGSSTTYFQADYNDDWQPVYVIRSGNHYNFDYNPFSITLVGSSYDEYDITLKFTDAGYVSNESETYSWTDYYDNDRDGEDETYTGDGTRSVDYTYDSDGHMTSYTNTYSASGRDYDGEKWSESLTTSAAFTWAHGDLIRATYTYKGNDDGDEINESRTEYYEYDGENEYNQPNLALAHSVGATTLSWDLSFIGYFGTGTSELLTKYSYEETDTDGDSYSGNSSAYSYTKNGSGALKTETIGSGSSYTYAYKDLSDYTKAGSSLSAGETGSTDAQDSRTAFRNRSLGPRFRDGLLHNADDQE